MNERVHTALWALGKRCTCKQDSAIKEHTIWCGWEGRVLKSVGYFFSSSLCRDNNGSSSGNILLWIHRAAYTSCNTIVTLPSLPLLGARKLQILPSWGQCNTLWLVMCDAVERWRSSSYWLAFIHVQRAPAVWLTTADERNHTMWTDSVPNKDLLYT